MIHVEQPFLPVYATDSHTLILGSFPSVRSRKEGFYYGHPKNRFWKMIAAVLNEPVPLSVNEKKELLLSHGLALWDVIESCDIEGSADSSIRNPLPAKIPELIRQSSVKRVLCNGKTSARLYRKYIFPETKLEAIVLPSTSPANAACSLQELTAIWSAALQE